MNETQLNKSRQSIASLIRKRRLELGLTQQQVADMTGMGLRTIIRMEDARFWPGLKQFILLVHHLEMELTFDLK